MGNYGYSPKNKGDLHYRIDKIFSGSGINDRLTFGGDPTQVWE